MGTTSFSRPKQTKQHGECGIPPNVTIASAAPGIGLGPSRGAFVGPAPKADEKEAEAFAKCIQSLICHENMLRNNRMTWFCTLQGFLWLSFAALHDNSASCKQGAYLLRMLPIIGFAICFFAVSAIWDADKAVGILFQRWKIYKMSTGLQYYPRPVIGMEPRPACHEGKFSVPKWWFPLPILYCWVVSFVFVLHIKCED